MSEETKPKAELRVFDDKAPEVVSAYATDEQARRVDKGIPLRRPSRIRPIDEDDDAADLAAMNASLAEPGRVPLEQVARELGW